MKVLVVEGSIRASTSELERSPDSPERYADILRRIGPDLQVDVRDMPTRGSHRRGHWKDMTKWPSPDRRAMRSAPCSEQFHEARAPGQSNMGGYNARRNL